MADSDAKKSGDKITVNFSGSNSGQMAVGSHNVQTQNVQTAEAPTAAEQAELQQMFDDLAASVHASESEDKEKALERVEELREAVTAEEPDISTMEYVKKWFVKNLPEVAGTVTDLVIHPIVGKLVRYAGQAVSDEFQRRFGKTE